MALQLLPAGHSWTCPLFCRERDFPLSLCCSASTEVFYDCPAVPALGPIRASQSHRPRYPRQPLALGPGNIPWKRSPTCVRRCAGAHSPPHLASPGGRSQPACSPAGRGESPRPQTGHMDNHLRLITRFCQRDGPQTSGSDKPPLLPPLPPEKLYQMLQGENTSCAASAWLLVGDPALQADAQEQICTSAGGVVSAFIFHAWD